MFKHDVMSPAPSRHSRGTLAHLRCAAELAAVTGAVDAAIATYRGGDLVVSESVTGSFPRRTVGTEVCPELSATALGADAPRWLSARALPFLYLPSTEHVLLVPIQGSDFAGAALLRYDRRPLLSRDDLTFMSASLAQCDALAEPALAA